jgi:dTMP kinase
MQTKSSRGILIAVEGIDGAGKTTQVARMRDALTAAGEIVVASKEPTTGAWGQKIRESAQNGRMAPDEELQAFLADRKEHVESLIAPSLSDGKIVLLDRYFYSTVAYQGARSGIDPCTLYAEMRERFPIPDVTYVIDVLPEVGLHRIAKLRGDTPNEFERLEDLAQNRQSFLRLLECAPEICRVDGHPDTSVVFHEIAHNLVDGVLKAKRCFKTYDCDIFYCSYRQTGECTWPAKRAAILAS